MEGSGCVTSNRDATEWELNSPLFFFFFTSCYHAVPPSARQVPTALLCLQTDALLVEQTPQLSLQLSCASLSLGSSLVGPDFCSLIPPVARFYTSTFVLFFSFQPINFHQHIIHLLSDLYHPPPGVIAMRSFNYGNFLFIYFVLTLRCKPSRLYH